MTNATSDPLILFDRTTPTPYPEGYSHIDFLHDALIAIGEDVQRIADERTMNYQGLLVRGYALVWFLDNRLPHIAQHEDLLAMQLLARKTAIVFHAQKRDAERVGGYWLPLAITPYHDRVGSGEVEYDLAFVGYIRDKLRADVFEQLKSMGISVRIEQGVFPPLSNDIYASARAGLNVPTLYGHHVSYDVNMRVFEIPACNAILLTNYLPELLELGFEPGFNCLTYRSVDGIERAVQWMRDKKNAHRLERIRNAGRALVLTRHTYTDRAYQVLNYIKLASHYGF